MKKNTKFIANVNYMSNIVNIIVRSEKQNFVKPKIRGLPALFKMREIDVEWVKIYKTTICNAFDDLLFGNPNRMKTNISENSEHFLIF
jgi:hypothetical protein